MHPVRIAVVGCGEGATRHHLPILARLPGAAIVALGRPDVDAVVLALPSGLHAETALAALGRGKHV